MPFLDTKDLGIYFIPAYNLTATRDPISTDDNTQQWAAGSCWVNTSNGRVWICQNAATGVAQWALACVPGVGVVPSSELTYFGGGTGTFLEEGNLNRQVVGTPVQPAATAGNYVLAAYSLPAGSFDSAGRGLTITAAGSFGATANAKRVQLIFNATTATVGQVVSGGTVIADTGSVTTNGGGWQLAASVFKYGATGSNTQLGIHNQSQVGGTVTALLAPSLLTATESGAIPIAVCGNATTAATDINFYWLEINGMN